MLHLDIPGGEFFDNKTNKFINVKPASLALEHSLVSISKWEAKWHKPFLGKEEKTTEQTLDYIKCMTLTQNIDPNIYLAFTNENLEAIRDYIEDPQSATTIKDDPNSPKSREIITSELIYYWMISMQIPVDICQKWHLNRLLTLIRVCGIKNNPHPKKMSQREIMSRNTALNAARRNRLHSRG